MADYMPSSVRALPKSSVIDLVAALLHNIKEVFTCKKGRIGYTDNTAILSIGNIVDETATMAVSSVNEIKTDVMHFSHGKLRTAPTQAIILDPCREVGGEGKGRRLPLMRTDQYNTRPSAERCAECRQSMCRASAAPRFRGVVPGHIQATVEPAYKRHTNKQPIPPRENEEGFEPVHKSYHSRLEDNTYHRPLSGEWDNASRPAPRSTATQVLRTAQVARQHPSSREVDTTAPYGFTICQGNLPILNGPGRLGPIEVFNAKPTAALKGLKAALNL
ncbi:hypothetical protein BKA59DRAFT_461320 [Fusarium tricinctum]|uniref:Reverse transcriptase domain-containing protein n=1 Tax=Fusarium tricinctum TaxID=61284 RepID=A0A8K0W5T1_9HYPO|nr:hypothetical protein BKA59DRAFT_461320 [Fusarium tricinctum]